VDFTGAVGYNALVSVRLPVPYPRKIEILFFELRKAFFLSGQASMDSETGAPERQIRAVDHDALVREIASLRTYLVVVAQS